MSTHPAIHRIDVVYADGAPGRDGIRDYSDGLVGALNEAPGVSAQFVRWNPSFGGELGASGATCAILQYNPYSYGKRGFAPTLLAQARRPRTMMLCVMVHEAYHVSLAGPRSAALGIWQRAQLRELLNRADATWISSERYRNYLPARHRESALHMPIGSPLPDARERRGEIRASLSVDESSLVVALYGSRNPSQLLGHCLAGIDGLIEAGELPVVLNLGGGATRLPALAADVRVVSPGFLAADDLAAYLAATDIALLPFSDGASARRTTMIAALQQQTCVVSTSGHMTDDFLGRSGAPMLTPVGDVPAFVATTIELMRDRALRMTCALTGRAVFDTHFSWPVLSRRLLAALPGQVT